jgi:archaeosine synthase beta-subunit
MKAQDRHARTEITRDRIEQLRGPKTAIDVDQPLGALWEQEPSRSAAAAEPSVVAVADVLSVFLAGAECAFRCTMCDLWKQTLPGPTPPGALTRQLRQALVSAGPSARHSAAGEPTAGSEQLPVAVPPEQWIKLYNASNFFDSRCVPRQDWDDLAGSVKRFNRVIVENHPRLIDDGVADFAGRLSGTLEVAMGLETVHEHSLALLNKQMTLADFERAADILRRSAVDLRVFVLLQPPGTRAEQAVHWVLESLRFAEHCGARHCSVIATRGGNGIMEALTAAGLFTPPDAFSLERVLTLALTAALPMVVTADLWDWERLQGHCHRCRDLRRQRMLEMNLLQKVVPAIGVDCDCQASSGIAS